MKLVHARFDRKSSKSKNINWKTGFIEKCMGEVHIPPNETYYVTVKGILGSP
jgi:hypothetical protein